MNFRKYCKKPEFFWMYSHMVIMSTLSLAWSIVDVVFSVMLERTTLIGLSSAVVAIALFSLIMTVLLIIFIRKPESTHRLTRISAHRYSLVVIGLLMFSITIPLLALTPGQCKRHGESSDGKYSDAMLCSWLCTTVAFTLSCALFAGLAVFLMHKRVIESNVKHETGTTNIASIVRARDS